MLEALNFVWQINKKLDLKKSANISQQSIFFSLPLIDFVSVFPFSCICHLHWLKKAILFINVKLEVWELASHYKSDFFPF